MKIHIGPYRKNRRVDVRIDKYDTWGMDSTLALIILPMLKQLKENKHGSPYVDDEDVPPEYRDVNEKIHEAWDWVMGEMIWAFEQKCRDDWESDYQIEEGELGKPIEVEIDGQILHEMNWVKEPVWDWDGRQAHQDRMSNGFRLFGKYYEGLWD